MESLQPRPRLGTLPPENDNTEESHTADSSHTEEPRLGLSFRLDRPFSELKQELVDELERVYVERCIAGSNNLSQASRASGLSRKHLRTLMAKHGIAR